MSRSESATEGPGRTIPDEQTATDPPMLFGRADSDQPPIRLVDTGTEETDRRSVHESHSQTTLVDSVSMADRLVEDGSTDSNSADTDLASFISATEFDTESLYLETRQVEQCFRLSLCYISWRDNEIRTDYGRVLRPYDEQCTVDTKVFESRLFRLPVAIGADEIRGHGSSISSSRCGPATGGANESHPTQSTEPRPRMNSSSQSPNGSASR